MENKMDKKWRYYRKEYPEVDDYVVVKVNEIKDVGAYVSLLEYGDIQGIILRTQFSKKYLRSIKSVLREGSIEVVNVLRVDEEKGYIDLSKSVVTSQDIKTTKEKYEKSKIVNSIVHSFSDKTKKDPSYLYETLVWNLYDEYEHAYYAFQHIMNSNDMKMLDILSEKERHILVGEIRKRFTTPPEKIRADFELRCYTEEGIEAIREVLMSIEDPSIQIQLVSSPVFLIQTETTDKEGGLKLILQSLKKIEEGILKKGGIYKLTVEPKVLTDHDKNRLEDERIKMEEICEEEEGMDDEEYTPPECEQ